jgi:hypothetical protein
MLGPGKEITKYGMCTDLMNMIMGLAQGEILRQVRCSNGHPQKNL